MATNTWPLAEAKAKLSEIIERAGTSGPQLITKHGRRVAQVTADNERSPSVAPNRMPLGDFLMNSPLRGSGLVFGNHREKVRRIKL
jgi:prevent-host-death family protein